MLEHVYDAIVLRASETNAIDPVDLRWNCSERQIEPQDVVSLSFTNYHPLPFCTSISSKKNKQFILTGGDVVVQCRIWDVDGTFFQIRYVQRCHSCG